MPSAIDQEALESPDLKILDYNKPPTKAIPYQSFPKMVYFHPTKDKTKEHKTLIVHDELALEKAKKQGYQLKPHVPQEVVELLTDY